MYSLVIEGLSECALYNRIEAPASITMKFLTCIINNGISIMLAITLIAWAMGTAGVGHAAEKSPPPNVVLILIDDMGWTDLSSQGSNFYETPNIDQLAKSGVRFTTGYSACTVCSPTRAAVLTGRYPARLHLTDWIAGHEQPTAKLKIPNWTKQLVPEEVTLAEVFRDAGYTTGCFGKWHLGAKDHRPETQGFQLNMGGTHVGQPPSYFFPYSSKNVKLPGLEEGERGEYLTDRLTSEVEKFITENKDRPFFAYVPHYTVHTPLQAKKPLIEKYAAKSKKGDDQANATYAAMIESLDESIGRITKKLAELKLTENTIVIFTSDNGGQLGNNITSNKPLRAGKGSAYEGGVRVPLIVSWPHKISANIVDVPAISCDLFPTLLELTEVENRSPNQIDGVSLASLLLKQQPIHRDAIYWHYPHYHPGGATPYSAMRAGNYRLIEFFEDGRLELYDLAQDVGEQHDLAKMQPEKRNELHAKLLAWRKEMNAQLPEPNPNAASK